jgi:Spy/CpxP family protein refolding chaperone
MATWGQGLVQKGIWGKEDLSEFQIWGGTAAGIKALMKLRETYEGRVPVQAAPSQESHSREELEAMVANPEYKTNPAYRAKVEKMFEQAFG